MLLNENVYAFKDISKLDISFLNDVQRRRNEIVLQYYETGE
jgi:hypothetical protein